MTPRFPTRRGFVGGLGAGAMAVSLADAANAVDLKDFGAKPGEDISEALSRALEESGGAPLFLGPGEYRLETPFVYHNRDQLGRQSRVPGFTLVGSGSRRTIIHCAHDGVAGMEVAQELPYRYTLAGRIQGLTLKGNPRAANQDGLRLSGAWNYVLSDVWIENCTGNGLSFPYREDLRWQLADVQTVAGSKIAQRTAQGGVHEEMAIWPTLRIFGAGIAPGTVISRMIDHTSFEMSAPATETGTTTIELVGNTDAFQSVVLLEACFFNDNQGWGLWGGAGIGVSLSWAWTEAQRNKLGGVYCGGGYWKFVGGNIAVNEGVGFLAERVKGSGSPSNICFEMIEFDVNQGGHVLLRDATFVSFTQCRFISHYSMELQKSRPEIGLTLGDTSAAGFVRGVELRKCLFRSAPAESASYSAIRFGAAGSYRHIEIIDCPWIVKGPHHRFLDNEPYPDAGVIIQQDGLTIHAGRTSRAWAILERGRPQKVRGGRPVNLLFEGQQGNLGGSTTAQRVVEAQVVGGKDELEFAAAVPSLQPGMPLADETGTALAPGTTIASASGKIVTMSKPALASGPVRIVVGGVRIPYSQLYEVEASVTIEGATAGAAIDLSLTVDGRDIRKSTVAGTAIARQTVSIRALLPLEAGNIVGVRISHAGNRELTMLGTPDSRNFSLIAAS
jgi:hypothetical protein